MLTVFFSNNPFTFTLSLNQPLQLAANRWFIHEKRNLMSCLSMLLVKCCSHLVKCLRHHSTFVGVFYVDGIIYKTLHFSQPWDIKSRLCIFSLTSFAASFNVISKLLSTNDYYQALWLFWNYTVIDMNDEVAYFSFKLSLLCLK